MTPEDAQDTLRKLNTAWLEKIRLGIEHKKGFQQISEQCMAFFKGSMGFMWDGEFQRKFMGSKVSPRFKITIAKAFEMVALFGPVLYHKNPIRAVRPYKPIEFSPELFGDPNDQNVQQQLQFQMSQEQVEQKRKELRCQLMETYLSYTPREQPNGGLEQAAEDAITEALIKGRGCLWSEQYSHPGSQTKLTGLFYDSVDNLVTDPDAKTINFGDTMWIARKSTHPTWVVERKFGWPVGSLEGKGQLESVEAQGSRAADPVGNKHRSQGLTFDLMTYWEVYSIGGVGSRLTGMEQGAQKAFSDVVGDYAYLVVAEGMDTPLNCPLKQFVGADDDQIKQMLGWPVPYYADQRWPVAILDFYRCPGTSWPISPMAPGLGELTAINVLISFLVDRIYSGARDFIAVAEQAADVIEKAYKGPESLVLFRLPPGVAKNISEVVSFLKQPPVNNDIYNIIEQLFDLFNKRVGLNDLLYGMNPGGTASRTASDINAKKENLSVRPDYLSKKVANWLTCGADLEKLCAYWSGISGRDIIPLVGQMGATFWDQLITQEDPEIVLRQMSCTVEADTVRKPNKARDSSNMQQAFQPLSQLATSYAQTTTDSGPLNTLMKKFGESIDLDMSGIQFGDYAPPPPPPGTPDPAQQEMEMKQQEMQMEMQIKQQELQMKQQEMQAKAQEMQLGAQIRAQEAQTDEQVRLREAQLEVQQQITELQMKQQELQMRAQEHGMDLQFNQQTHALDLKAAREKIDQDAKLAALKIAVAKAQAKAKRTTTKEGK